MAAVVPRQKYKLRLEYIIHVVRIKFARYFLARDYFLDWFQIVKNCTKNFGKHNASSAHRLDLHNVLRESSRARILVENLFTNGREKQQKLYQPSQQGRFNFLRIVSSTKSI